MADKYVQLHPLNETKTALDESVNAFPYIGPNSFKDFDPEAATEPNVFKPQEKLVSGENIKALAFSEKQPAASLLGNGILNLPLLDLLYPVGSIYMCAEDKFDGICPIQQLLGGTWVRIKDKFMYAAGDEDELGATGGSKDAVVVEHIHETSEVSLATTRSKDLTTYVGLSNTQLALDISGQSHGCMLRAMLLGENDPDHVAAEAFLTAFQAGNTAVTYALDQNSSLVVAPSNVKNFNFTVKRTIEGNIPGPGGSPTAAPGIKLKLDLNHEHTIPNHQHTAMATGVSGVGKNMPPYLVVYMWKRVENVESEEE